jgi:dihydroorotate dehydrogenase
MNNFNSSRTQQHDTCRIVSVVSAVDLLQLNASCTQTKGGYTLVTLPRIVTPYRDSVDETRDRVTYEKLVTR